MLAGFGKSAVGRALIREKLMEGDNELPSGPASRPHEWYPTMDRVWRRDAYNSALEAPSRRPVRASSPRREPEGEPVSQQQGERGEARAASPDPSAAGAASQPGGDGAGAAGQLAGAGARWEAGRRGRPTEKEGWHLEQLLKLAAKPFPHGILSLVEAGVDINQCGWNEQTALAVASSRGHVNTVAELLRLGAGASLHIPNSRGWTPLMLAAARGHKDVVTLLLAAGVAAGDAAVDAVNRDGRTALGLAGLD
jgi:hypothetical protein